jgi:signal peptidase I
MTSEPPASKPAAKPATAPAEPLGEVLPKPTWRVWWENFQLLVVAFILALLIRAFVAEPRFIPSESMVPSLLVGDRIVVEKLSYHWHNPDHGDIIVFDPPELLQRYGFGKDQVFIKRIVGIPGDTLEVKAGSVYLNGIALNEPYINAAPDYTMPQFQVPDDQYFVMGDNRNNSTDSHIWGFLPRQNIIGRAWFEFWPLKRFDWLR